MDLETFLSDFLNNIADLRGHFNQAAIMQFQQNVPRRCVQSTLLSCETWTNTAIQVMTNAL
jgi:hypothetical protein